MATKYRPAYNEHPEVIKTLYQAAQWNHPDLLAQFIREGKFKINERLGNWYAPLHVAAQNGHLACVKLLVEHGADTNIKNPSVLGNPVVTPLDLARKNNHKGVVEYLEAVASGSIKVEQKDALSAAPTTAGVSDAVAPARPSSNTRRPSPGVRSDTTKASSVVEEKRPVTGDSDPLAIDYNLNPSAPDQKPAVTSKMASGKEKAVPLKNGKKKGTKAVAEAKEDEQTYV